MSAMGQGDIKTQLRERVPTISVGLISADLTNLGSDVKTLEDAGVAIAHFDVMDGCFCPMMTVGPPFIKAVKTRMLKDVHLMIADPLDKIDAYVAAGADIITVHLEGCVHPHRVLQVLGAATNANDPRRGIVRGVALNPGTPLSTLEPLMDEIDMVCLVAINPGWGGQGFIAATKRRVAELKSMAAAHGKEILIGVDGGIKKDNLEMVARLGAEIIVTGSAVFDGKDAGGNARSMLELLSNIKG
jgi:ribulose-phosphate 3-epimerase